MSRGTDYKFVQTDPAGVLSALITKYEELTGRTLLPADPDRVFVSWVADVIIQERLLLNFSANQNIPSRAVGSNLDALGEFIYNLKRPTSKPSECTIRFTLTGPQETAINIPIGTRVTDLTQKMTWKTDEDAVVPIGETTVLVPAVCITAGTIGNGYVAGQISKLVDVDNVEFFQSCENVDTSSGGSDKANDTEYYELLRQSLEAYSTAGPKGAYEYHAKAVSSGIADVCAINPLDMPGVVHIYAVMNDGSIADDGTKNAIFEACNDEKVRPLTDLVEVLDPETVGFDIDLTYYVDRNSTKTMSDIAADVRTAVDEYIKWQTARIGRDINPSKLSWLLHDTGIKRMDIKLPVYTPLRDSSARITPQFARHSSTKITNGGFEDE